mmetsp:Transcript_73678/g.159439  ORF Transcript_73678/g.159439 Transcript_73678/m.159439 type:complete len:282 (+) Transcript_73678:1148-1993(+)
MSSKAKLVGSCSSSCRFAHSSSAGAAFALFRTNAASEIVKFVCVAALAAACALEEFPDDVVTEVGRREYGCDDNVADPDVESLSEEGVFAVAAAFEVAGAFGPSVGLFAAALPRDAFKDAAGEVLGWIRLLGVGGDHGLAPFSGSFRGEEALVRAGAAAERRFPEDTLEDTVEAPAVPADELTFAGPVALAGGTGTGRIFLVPISFFFPAATGTPAGRAPESAFPCAPSRVSLDGFQCHHAVAPRPVLAFFGAQGAGLFRWTCEPWRSRARLFVGACAFFP